ncbi:VCBS repeat-containing protein [Streptomyces coryli]|nr:VCBS repeat-containing protein [Streptomyces coryli]
MPGLRSRLVSVALAGLCTAGLLSLAGCSVDQAVERGEDPLPGWSKSRERDAGEANRDDIDGDGHADAVIGDHVALARPGSKDPAAALRRAEPLPPLPAPKGLEPFPGEAPTARTGDLDDDGYADIAVVQTLQGERRAEGNKTEGYTVPVQRVVWSGPDGVGEVTELPGKFGKITAIGDFDGDGALDLLTLGPAATESDHKGKRQWATVLHGPLNRAGARPRTTTRIDVGYDGWVPVAHAVVGDFDGDGRDDLVTKAECGEEDGRLEGDAPDLDDATYYRGTKEGLENAGSVPGITEGDTPVLAADFNGDGRDDILGANSYDGEAGGSIVYGAADGPGEGRKSTSLTGGWVPGGVAGEWNGDRRADVAMRDTVGDRMHGEVSVSGTRIDAYELALAGDAKRKGYASGFAREVYGADLDADGTDELVLSHNGFHKPRKDPGYWILRGTRSGPSMTGRSSSGRRTCGGASAYPAFEGFAQASCGAVRKTFTARFNETVEGMENAKFVLEVDLSADTFRADAAGELGRILRYWGGSLRHYELTPGTAETIYDSAYNEAGTWRISPKGA